MGSAIGILYIRVCKYNRGAPPPSGIVLCLACLFTAVYICGCVNIGSSISLCPCFL
jgi:hypothetical protein